MVAAAGVALTVVAAGVAFAMFVDMVVTMNGGVKKQGAFQQGVHSGVGAAGNAAVQPDAGLGQGLLGAAADGEMAYTVPDYAIENGLGSALLEKILHTFKEVGMALGLIVVFFAVLQIFVLKLPKKKLLQIAVGIAYTFFGLVIFLDLFDIPEADQTDSDRKTDLGDNGRDLCYIHR